MSEAADDAGTVWEVVYRSDSEVLDRRKVPSGWLYRSTLTKFGTSNEPVAMSMTFVPLEVDEELSPA